MRRWIMIPLLLLINPAIAHASAGPYPADLSKWLRTDAPFGATDRYYHAYWDTSHTWVVHLRGARPMARLWARRIGTGAFYPRMQESYPRMPFEVQEDFKVNGHAGEWFRAKVRDGWIIGFNKGEWGGGLWWYSRDGKKQVKISDDQVVGFIETKHGLLALAGCGHAFANDGQILRLIKGGDGRWHSERLINLRDTPEVGALDRDGTLVVATYHRLLRIDLKSRKVEEILKDAFWDGLGPNSIVLPSSGSIFVGMRHGVAEFEKAGALYNLKWLIPDAEYAKSAVANLRPGFR